MLDLLRIVPAAQSQDYVANKKQFQLHTLITEQRHPKTWDLSQIIQTDTLAGIQALLSVDTDIAQKFIALSDHTTLLDQAASAVKKAILENKKVYIYGCGATGRLAKQMESSFWRPFWKMMQSLPHWEAIKSSFPDIENRLIGEMTGADRALISSLEGFEDLQLIGALQLEDHGNQWGDAVFAITEGGETSSVIGTILAALRQYPENDANSATEAQQRLYFIYNNPDQVLLPYDRSRSVIENQAITKICLCTGPQAITGSTRMQATTSETFVMGIILEQALYELLEPHLSSTELAELGFQASNMQERLLSFLAVQQAVNASREALSLLTDLEAATCRNNGFSTYFAEAALMTVFTDSTERSPTFRLSPLDTYDAAPRKSWVQVWTPAVDKLSAWKSLLGRPFYGLEKEFYAQQFSQGIEDAYLKAMALKSLDKAGNEQQYLYDFSYSQANVAAHGPQQNDLGVMVLFADEIAQLTDDFSPFKSWLKTFARQAGQTGRDLAAC